MINKIKYIVVFVMQLLVSQSVISQSDTTKKFHINTAFKVDEELKYTVKYGLIKGGEASLKIKIVPVGYTYYYHAKAVAKTTGLAAKVATIYDIYESYINITTGYPLKSIRNIRENKYLKYNEVLFARDSNKILSLNSGKKTVPSNTLDILSAFYYARRFLFDKNYEKNQIINLITYFDDELFPIKIKYKKKEKVRTKFGKIECLKFVPIIEKNSPFKKEEDMEVWFTNDGNYIPVKIVADMPFSSIRCQLIGFNNLKNPFGGKPQKK